jgi:hypothetical protein
LGSTDSTLSSQLIAWVNTGFVGPNEFGAKPPNRSRPEPMLSGAWNRKECIPNTISFPLIRDDYGESRALWQGLAQLWPEPFRWRW